MCRSNAAEPLNGPGGPELAAEGRRCTCLPVPTVDSGGPAPHSTGPSQNASHASAASRPGPHLKHGADGHHEFHRAELCAFQRCEFTVDTRKRRVAAGAPPGAVPAVANARARRQPPRHQHIFGVASAKQAKWPPFAPPCICRPVTSPDDLVGLPKHNDHHMSLKTMP